MQIEFPSKFRTIFNPARYKVYYGGRGSSKSHSVARFLLIQSLSRKVRILCARELQNSIHESVYRLFTELIDQYRLSDSFRITQQGIFSSIGSEFIFKGIAKNPDALKSTEGIDYCWVEEAERVTERSWELLLPTIRKPGSEILITFNPQDTDDPVYQRFVVNTPENSICELVNYSDNPWFPEVLKQELEAMKERDYDKYLHVWEGHPRAISDAQVFKGKIAVCEFNNSSIESYLYGLDFGFGPDPCALTRSFVVDNTLYIDYEAYGYRIELGDLPQFMGSVPGAGRYTIQCDPSRPETIEFLRKPQNGAFNTVGAKRWEGSIEDGVEFLRSFDKIYIHPRCVNTIDEFKRYSYKVDPKTDRILPILSEKANHSIDSVRYACGDLIQRRCTIFGR